MNNPNVYSIERQYFQIYYYLLLLLFFFSVSFLKRIEFEQPWKFSLQSETLVVS